MNGEEVKSAILALVADFDSFQEPVPKSAPKAWLLHFLISTALLFLEPLGVGTGSVVAGLGLSGQISPLDDENRIGLGAMNTILIVFTAQNRALAALLLPANFMVKRATFATDDRLQGWFGYMVLHWASTNWTMQA